ncbi:unnamed protein product [Aphanomyces euteiches]
MEIIRSTLVLREVWATINQYQLGACRAILPFLKVASIVPGQTNFNRWVHSLQAKLDDFYAEYGTSSLDELVQHLPSMKDNLMIAASAANDVAMLEILHEKFDLFSCQLKLLNFASKCGNMEALVYLHKLGHPGCSHLAMDLAACGGHLDIVKFLHSNRKEGCTAQAINLAAEFGRLEVLEWLYVNTKAKHTSYAMDHAASVGALAIVQRLHDRGFVCTTEAMNTAIRKGNIPLVEWLHAYRTEGFGNVTMDLSVEMIAWLCVNRCDFDPRVCLKQAVWKDRIDVIKLLVDRFGVPWSEELTQGIVKRGTLASLCWLHDRNPAVMTTIDQSALWDVEFSLDLLDIAAARSRKLLLAWLVKTNRLDTETFNAYSKAWD